MIVPLQSDVQFLADVTATIERARSFGDAAKQALLTFPDSPARQALLAASDFAIERAF